MTVDRRLVPAEVNVRIKRAALWASMLFVFAHVGRLPGQTLLTPLQRPE